MYSGAAADYLLALSVSILGNRAIEAGLTFADVLRFAMTVEKTWRRARPSRSIRVPVVEQSK